MAVKEQGPQRMRVGPLRNIGRQTQCLRVPACVSSPHEPLGPHVQKPPRKPLAVHGSALIIQHDKALVSHRYQQPQALDLAVRPDAVNRGLGQPSHSISQSVVNSSCEANTNKLWPQRCNGTGQRWLADFDLGHDLLSGQRPCCKQEPDSIKVRRHGVNCVVNN